MLWAVAPPHTRSALGFVLGFGAWLLLFSLLLQVPAVQDGLVLPMTRGITLVSDAALGLLGYRTEVAGTVIRGDEGFAVNILTGCNGAFVMAIFASAVLAFPVPWRLRAVGLAAGLPAVQLINLGRILSLYAIGVHRPDLFERFHTQVWQTAVILLSMALWLAWADLSHRATRP